MEQIVLERLVKRYGSVTALDGIDLEIADGEFLSLLGPSGCGKTTTLRLIAGLEDPDGGRVLFDGREVSGPGGTVSPDKRNLGMVFQNYALWSHMSVAENVGYPLKLRRIGRAERDERVRWTLDLLGLAGLEARAPDQLSGGQQQRVALARALVVQPRALLLDEPLSNIDAKLRERMRVELAALHRKLGLTIVYVTHDQVEAMTLSDRIVLMRNRRIAQIGSARALYREPVDAFVAEFIGEANLVPCVLLGLDGCEARVRLDLGGRLAIEHAARVTATARPLIGEKGHFFVRPEHLVLGAPDRYLLRGKIETVMFRGDAVDVQVLTGEIGWRAKVDPDLPLREGTPVSLGVKSALFIPMNELTVPKDQKVRELS